MDKQTILTLAALLLTSSAWGQSKQEGEVELTGGYGNTAPYASRLQLNLEEGKVVFKPFVGIKGLARHSSEQNLDEHYIFLYGQDAPVGNLWKSVLFASDD